MLAGSYLVSVALRYLAGAAGDPDSPAQKRAALMTECLRALALQGTRGVRHGS